MYKDFFPPIEGGVRPPTPVVGVITTRERVRPEAVMATCRRYGAVSNHDGETFWVVFEDEPKRAWDFGERGLRSSVDTDGYIKCDSYKAGAERTHPDDGSEEIPSFLASVGNFDVE